MPTMTLTPWQLASVFNPFKHFTMFGGVGAGKTMSLAHFAIWHLTNKPQLTGMIGANSHNQMSQATLREMFYWLDAYGLEFVCDRIPPDDWTGGKRQFKSYKDVLTVRNPKTGSVAYAFVRVLSDPDALRGIEFSWYVLDESRDTPDESFRIIIGRMRESNYNRGLIGTTTNGEDWVYDQFFKGQRKGDILYGCMHVRTIETVKIGLHSQDWYDSLCRTYSTLYAAQELDAEHVNIQGGRAYYAAGKQNKTRTAPWGDEHPNPKRPLIVGCDFNFSPAPCIWMVGQLGPDMYGPDGRHWGSMIHWFGEIAEVEMSTPGMTRALLSRFPGFFYRVFGDCSGGRGTTSNAGISDYDQMALVFNECGAAYSIDYHDEDDEQNPRVKNRVENMNAKFCNSLGEVSQTYNPDACPHFDDDVKYTGWKLVSGQSGRGKLSDGGNCKRTHATDGAGYAVYKLLPAISNFSTAYDHNVTSKIRSENALLQY